MDLAEDVFYRLCEDLQVSSAHPLAYFNVVLNIHSTQVLSHCLLPTDCSSGAESRNGLVAVAGRGKRGLTVTFVGFGMATTDSVRLR